MLLFVVGREVWRTRGFTGGGAQTHKRRIEDLLEELSGNLDDLSIKRSCVRRSERTPPPEMYKVENEERRVTPSIITSGVLLRLQDPSLHPPGFCPSLSVFTPTLGRDTDAARTK